MNDQQLKRILDLEAQIKYHDYLYFNKDEPVISDSEYDLLAEEYFNLLEECPDYKPQIRVGFVEIDDELPTVVINEDMRSISKKKDPEDFRKWVKVNAGSNATYEDKLDGVAVRLVYVKGVLTLGHSRGRGDVGADLTGRLHLVTGIPKEIEAYKKFDRREVTGEAFTTYKDFEAYVERHKLDPKTIDPRGTVSGLLRRITPGEMEDLPIYFKAYSAGKDTVAEFDTYPELRDHLENIGFDLPMLFELSEIEEMLSLSSKPVGEYPIDGLVAKCNDLRLWEKPQKGEYYTYATCYKFPTKSYETKATGIDWSLSNEGELIGTLLYEKVEYEGTNLTRCKLDYAPSYFEKGLGMGSIIRITKANEIIPKLVAMVTPATGEKFKYPDNCPFCNHPIELDPRGVGYCKNDACEGQLVKRLIRLVEKKGLNIKGLGDVYIQKLVDNGFLSNPADLFKLTKEDLINTGISESESQAIIEKIAAANDRDIMHWLFALAIPGLGLVRAGDISNLAATNGLNDGLKFHTAEDVVRILSDVEFIQGLFGLDGLVIVNHVRSDAKNITEFLRNYDFNRQGKHEKAIGIPVAITGAWAALTRPLMEEGLNEAGYTLSETVTKSVKILLIADKPSASKVEKAKRYGIPAVNITQVHSMAGIIDLIEALPQ